MASGDQKYKHRGWSVGFWSNGSSNSAMANTPWEGPTSPFKPSRQRSGTRNVREDWMWVLIYLLVAIIDYKISQLMSLTMTNCMWTSNLYLNASTYIVPLTLWVNSRNHTRLTERYDDYTTGMNSRYLASLYNRHNRALFFQCLCRWRPSQLWPRRSLVSLLSSPMYWKRLAHFDLRGMSRNYGKELLSP